MKHTIKKEIREPEFVPLTVTITLESMAELKELHRRIYHENGLLDIAGMADLRVNLKKYL